MSGVGEVGAIVGLILGTIDIVNSTATFYQSFKDDGQPKEFRSIVAKFPLILEILETAKKDEAERSLNESGRSKAEDNIRTCTEKIEALKKIFAAVLRHDDDNWLERYKKAIIGLSKGKRAEELMREIMEHIELVTCDKLMGTATRTQIEKLQEAIQEMLDMPSSISDDDRPIIQNHTGSGHNNNISNRSTNNNTSTGVQQVNNGGGTQNYNVYKQSRSNKSTTLLQSLYFPEMDLHKKDISEAVDNTCEWLCDEPDYKDWLARNQRLLWIVGIPGSGKSTIMKYIYQQDTSHLPGTEPPEGTLHPSQRPRKRPIVASFFCYGAGDPIQKNRIGLFRSLLHQILQQIPELPPEVFLYFDKRCKLEVKPGENLEWHQHDLKEMLQTSILYIAKEYPDEYVLRIYVDALDEFRSNEPNGSKEPRDLAEYFQSLTSLDILGIDLNVCISCRDYPFVAKGGLNISIGNKNHQDISTYVQNKLAGIQGEGYEVRQLINWIVGNASGIFQWAVIVVEKARVLNEHIESPKHILKELEHLPQGLDKLYEKSFTAMDIDNRPQSMRLLRWICFAQRPLFVEELHDALLFDSSVTTWRESMDCKKSRHEMENIIKILSCNLVVINQKNEGYHTHIVQLRHQSVHDYLVSSGLQHLDDSIQTSTSLATSEIHFQLLKSCVRYLSSKELVTRCDLLQEFRGGAEIDDKQVTKGLEYACPFLQYAIKHWAYHAKLAEDDNSEQEDLLQLYQCLPNAPFGKLNEASTWTYYHDEGLTLLHLASQYGLLKLVTLIFKSQNNPKVTSVTTRRHAVNNVMEKLSQMTSKKVDVDMKTLRGMTPLTFAIQGRHEAIVQQLLENHSANVNKTVRNVPTLLWAAMIGHKETMTLFLEQSKTKVNAKDKSGRTALIIAASDGNEETVKLLLSNSKIKVNGTDNQSRTALLHATSKGHKGIVSMLLDCGMIKVNAKDKLGITSLMDAAKTGQREIVEMLLRDGNVGVNAINMEKKTALFYAVQGGHDGIVELLLQHSKVDPNAGYEFLKGPPLYEAVTKRNKAIATLLLRNIEINVNKPGYLKQTPLFIAAKYGYSEMVILLLEKRKADIDISARNEYDQSPLTIAIEKKYWIIVDLLLKEKRRMSKSDKQVAQALENLSLNGRDKMSDDMKKRSEQA